MDIGNIGIWLLLGVLVACCVVPMLMMGRHGKHGGDQGKTPPPPSGPSGRR